MELYQKIYRITDILRRDDGISGAMHYTEQISWLLFLKFINDLEEQNETNAVANGREYKRMISAEYTWSVWTREQRTGDELICFVNDRLFPYLRTLRNNSAEHSIQSKIGDIFEFVSNRIANGLTLREVLDIIDTINFSSRSESDELSHVYEYLLRDIGSDGFGSGEFYTPLAITKAVVGALQPRLGQTVYDCAAGSGGFLIEALEHVKKNNPDQIPKEKRDFLYQQTFFGNEKNSLAYVIGTMNMILHGIESPNLKKCDTLELKTYLDEKDIFDIVIANPPFGGREKEYIQDNFPIKSSATTLLFLQHIMGSLKQGGKAAVVVPEDILFQNNSAYRAVKEKLLTEFNLHTILSLPVGAFQPLTGVKTNVLFFDRAGTTTDIWYYECSLPDKLTKNKPISVEHLAGFVELFEQRSTTEHSWKVPVSEIKDTDLSARNPGNIKIRQYEAPDSILLKIRKNDNIENDLLKEIGDIITLFNSNSINELPKNWEMKTISSIAKTTSGGTPKRGTKEFWENGSIPWLKSGELNDNTSISNSEEFITQLGLDHSAAKLFPRGTLLIALYGGTAGKLGILGFDAATNQAVCSIQQTDGEKLFEEKYLFYFLLTKREKILNDSSGVAQQNISKKYLDEIQVPMPKTLSEQQRIVKILDQIFTRIDRIVEEKERKLGKLKELKDSILDKAFRGEI